MTHSPTEDHGTAPVRAGVPVIGGSGAIASGKSEVARRLAARGALLLDADAIGHQVLHEPQVQQALQARWGDSVLHPDGTVNRRAVAERVFGGTATHQQERRFLEQTTHPRIGRRLAEMIEHSRAGEAPAVVLDAALLFEAGWDRLCDVLLFVDAPLELRRQRALRRGWDTAQLLAREAAQADPEHKRQRAQMVVDNSRDGEYLEAQLDRYWPRILAGRPGRTQSTKEPT
jgi:dephospho-CoA kinase